VADIHLVGTVLVDATGFTGANPVLRLIERLVLP